MKPATAPSALKVQAALGPEFQVLEFEASTRTFIDGDLQRFPSVWAAGGTPNAVFRISPADLTRLTGARVADVVRR